MPRFIPTVAPFAAVTALLLSSGVLAQGTPAGGDEAMNAIQSNFARMTPAPRTVSSINQELRQDHAAPVAGAGRGGGGGGRGRGGRQRPQDSAKDGGSADSPAAQEPPLRANTPVTASQFASGDQ